MNPLQKLHHKMQIYILAILTICIYITLKSKHSPAQQMLPVVAQLFFILMKSICYHSYKTMLISFKRSAAWST